MIMFYVVLAYAQDSIGMNYFYSQDQRYAETLVLSPVNSRESNISDYGILQLQHEVDRGGFRRAQQAFEKQSTSFAAVGFNTLGRFRIGARFAFNMIEEDSLANGQRNDLDDLISFYPYANKSGHYRRQNYRMNGSLSYAVTDYIFPFIKLAYHKHQSAGTVDPRLMANRFVFKVMPGVATAWGKHVVGAYAILGKADETVSLKYKSATFKESLLYPDRIYYMNYGYGSSKLKDSSTNYRYDTYRGGGVEYASQLRNWKLQVAGEYEWYHNTNQVQSKANTRYNGPLATFDLSTLSVSVSAFRQTKDGKQQSGTAEFMSSNGQDGNVLTTGRLDIVNYRVKTRHMQLTYAFLWDKQRVFSKEVGLAVYNSKMRRMDLLQSVLLDVTDAKAMVWFHAYLKRGTDRWIRLGASSYYSVPHDGKLTFNVLSVNEFIRNVVLTDYHYYQSKFFGTALEGEYMGRWFGRNDIGLYLTMDYRQADVPDLRQMYEQVPTFIPTAHRFAMKLGVRMYLNEK